mgnify:CR=1 FL=1
MMTIDEFKAIKKPKKSKYKSVKCEHFGVKLDSLKEKRQYIKYLHQQSIGEILSIKLQPKYDLIVNGIKIGFYKADFEIELADKSIQVIDVKSEMTRKLPVYRLKKKMIKAIYNIDIIEI